MAVLFGETILASSGMQNGKLSVTVSSNNLTVAIKTFAGTDPSTSDPVYVAINGVLRSITAALSITITAGTNWFNSGGNELKTILVPYFPYAVYDSNSSAVALTVGRKPTYMIVASGMSTTTSEDHIYGYSGFTNGDDMVNIGYFEATLSGGAGYTWTVPTFTADNLRHTPTYHSNVMNFLPQWTSLTDTSGTTTAKYQIVEGRCNLHVEFVLGASSAISGSVSHTLPIGRANSYGGTVNPALGVVKFKDASPSATYYGTVNVSTTSATLLVFDASSTYAKHTGISANIPILWTTSDEILHATEYPIV
jgi:hypothetical protein